MNELEGATPKQGAPLLSIPDEIRGNELHDSSGFGFADNFRHTYDSEIAEQLKHKPACSRYAGLHFHGFVMWLADRQEYLCEVWRFHRHVDSVCAPTMKELMKAVSDAWGWE